MVFRVGPYDNTRGKLNEKKTQPNVIEVYFVPSKDSLIAAGLNLENTDQHRTELFKIDEQKRCLTIHPLSSKFDEFLKPKYEKVRYITLPFTEIKCSGFYKTPPIGFLVVLDVLEKLPSGFTKDYTFGLGLAQTYRFIIEAVEKLSDCTELVITSQEVTGPSPDDNTIFYISMNDFNKARLAIDRIDENVREAKRTVKQTEAYNIIAERLGKPKREPNIGRAFYRKLFTKLAQGNVELSEEDQNEITGVVSDQVTSIAEENPKKLAKLRADIDLVNLEQLIKRYEEMLTKRNRESKWQKFFNDNPFILNMAFGYAVIKVQEQASVGGNKLSGDGIKIADFLVKNKLTNNTAIVEIKTPQTPIVSKQEYRDGVYTPSSHLSGAINQVLDQKYQFEKQIAQIKDNSRLRDIESYAVHCCLIVGQTPKGDNEQKSFEMFRRNSKNVEIVTFDELLEKLKQLRIFLQHDKESVSPQELKGDDNG